MGLDQRNAMVRSYLVGVTGRAEKDLPTYGDLHRIFGGGFQNQGGNLQKIFEDCRANGEPDLTVLVVGTRTRFPTQFEERLWQDTPECRSRWRAALQTASTWQWKNSRFV